MKNKLKEYKTEIYLYKIGFIVILLSGIGYAAAKSIMSNHVMGFIPCMWHAVFGIYCPGCGGTRAFTLFLEGHIIKSAIYNPFVTYAFVMLLAFEISWSVYFLSKKRIRGMIFRPWFAYAAFVILILQWIIKNILLLVFHIDLLK